MLAVSLTVFPRLQLIQAAPLGSGVFGDVGIVVVIRSVAGDLLGGMLAWQ